MFAERISAAVLIVAVAAFHLPGQAQQPDAPGDLVPRLQAAAGSTDAEAIRERALLNLEGRGAGNPAQSAATLAAAADAGDAGAALALGNAFFEGRSLAPDRDAALEWWRRAAESGVADAQYNLGLVLLQAGEDTGAALAWLERAADADHVLACFAAGTWHAAHGTEPARTERHLNCAARQGYAPAQYNLARWHLEGGRAELARTWFEAAAVTFEPAASALALLPAPAPKRPPDAAVAAPAPPPALPGSIHGADWVNAQPASNYTLQVAASHSGPALKRLLHAHAPEEVSAYFLHRPRAREPYSAVIGSYRDYASAERGLADLRPALMANAPYIRRFGNLQRELRGVEQPAEQNRTAEANAEN